MMSQLKLFDDREQLQLPVDLMDYQPDFFDAAESLRYLDSFMQYIPWEQHRVKMYEKEVWTPRL